MARLTILAASAEGGGASGDFMVLSTHGPEGRGSTGILSTGILSCSSAPVVETRGTPPGGATPEAVNAATACGPSAGGGAPATFKAAGVPCVNDRPQASGVISPGATFAADPSFAAALQALLTGMVRADGRPRLQLTSD